MEGHGVVDLDGADGYNGGKGNLAKFVDDPANQSFGAIFGQQINRGRSAMMSLFHISLQTTSRKLEHSPWGMQFMTMRITLDQNLE